MDNFRVYEHNIKKLKKELLDENITNVPTTKIKELNNELILCKSNYEKDIVKELVVHFRRWK